MLSVVVNVTVSPFINLSFSLAIELSCSAAVEKAAIMLYNLRVSKLNTALMYKHLLTAGLRKSDSGYLDRVEGKRTFAT
jgi:hypothetical protein